jgi:NAD(P)-dependent dehydrogenase (short-subunit alcohol dehydrogenase family)
MTLFDDVEEAPSPQRVLVTGGAGGLGQVIACRFHESGARVHLCDSSAAALALALASHPGMHGTVADVARSEEVALFVREAREWMGGVDVLVNCAGEVGPRAPLEEIEDDEWTRALEVNLSGMFYCIREVAPLMKAQRSGAIVNIGSTSSREVGLALLGEGGDALARLVALDEQVEPGERQRADALPRSTRCRR